MPSVLILFAHPRFEKSRASRALVNALPDHPDLTFHDLYENYPDYNIDLDREKVLLEQHDTLIWHHPLYWYSCPPLLKQWIDIVLEYGWAYGPEGNALKKKLVFNVLTTGGTPQAYSEAGRNKYTLQQFLRPFEQTARLCKMNYLPPFALMGSHRLQEEELRRVGEKYTFLLEQLLEGKVPTTMTEFSLLNDWLEQASIKNA